MAEVSNPGTPAIVHAQALAGKGQQGARAGAIVEGPFGFDRAIVAEVAHVKEIDSQVSGAADPLYKSFNSIGAGGCAGLVLDAKVPVVLNPRADSLNSRMALVALAVLAIPPF